MKAIGRRTCRKRYTALPISRYSGNQLIYPKVYGMYVLTLPSKSAIGHAKNIAVCLQQLIKSMGFGKLIFMAETPLPWLYRGSDYKPAKEAVEYLIGNNISKAFNGGIVITTDEIFPFVKHLFWLVRTNTIMPYVYAVDEGQHIVINICQHGSIHFDTLDKQTDKLFHKYFPSSGLQVRAGNTCFSPWQKAGKIEGRNIIV